jgi:ABC-type sugar transport system ATPase subunit
MVKNGNCQSDYILDVQGVSKRFPGVLALDHVDLKVKKGSVHGVMGENGAGKSTLMNILMGILPHDTGKIFFRGEEVSFKGPHDALNSGLCMIHQELSTIIDLTVAENIFLGREITYGKSFFNKKKEMSKKTRELFADIGIDIDPDVKMKTLSMAQQQLCEIAKAISYDSDLIIMDEPTSAITESEVEHLFKIIRNLTARGVTIIYITHKMSEVFEITDYISVYRDGKYIGTVKTTEVDNDVLVEMMVGRKITQMFSKVPVTIGEQVLRVEGLSRYGEFENISFELRKGEILGVAGLMGAGRSEIMETLFGIRKKSSGKIFINGNEVRIRNPRDAIKHGIGFLTEDRKESGCFLSLSVRINTCLASIYKFSRNIFIKKKKTIADAEKMRSELSIKTPSIETKIANLSGGNQQKVLVGRWLLTEPEILIVDEPTRGIDVGSKSEIYRLISNLAQQGKAIIMISSEMPAILGMSDRIMVVSEGKIAGFMDTKDATQQRILMYATGEHKAGGIQ